MFNVIDFRKLFLVIFLVFNGLSYFSVVSATAITSVASNQGHHITWTYFYNKSPKLNDQIVAEIKTYAKSHIPKTNGHRSVTWSNNPPWNKGKSVLLTGAIEQYKQGLDAHLRRKFPHVNFAAYRPAHVDVNGKYNVRLYSHINTTQLSVL